MENSTESLSTASPELDLDEHIREEGAILSDQIIERTNELLTYLKDAAPQDAAERMAYDDKYIELKKITSNMRAKNIDLARIGTNREELNSLYKKYVAV